MLSVADRAAKVRFRRAMSLMAMTLVAPGLAQIIAGNARVGRVALRIWVLLWSTLAVACLLAVADRDFAFWMATSTTMLFWLRLGLLVGAVGWAALFMDAWRLGQPLSYGLGQRRAAVGINGVLCFSVAGTLLFGAHLVGVQRDFIISVFGDGEATPAHAGRYNVLLLGGDSGAGRWGLRPDSLTVASIDEDTGRTVLIGLPRNMANFPFRSGTVMAEQFPDGFGCADCYLNGVSTWAEDNTELFGESDTPGVDATVMAVEGITGLRINYWAMVNMQGFKDLVDAVGGVELTVRQPIPVGGLGDDVTGYIDPGVRTLDGFDTLWFTRAREGSDDYSRMARQKCVMNAMLQQISPQKALANFEKIATASAAMISTDIPHSELDTFLSLADKARSQQMSSVALVPPLVNTADPDIGVIHDEVQAAIAKAEGEAPRAKKGKRGGNGKSSSAPATTGGSKGSLADGYEANATEDLDTAC